MISLKILFITLVQNFKNSFLIPLIFSQIHVHSSDFPSKIFLTILIDISDSRTYPIIFDSVLNESTQPVIYFIKKLFIFNVRWQLKICLPSLLPSRKYIPNSHCINLQQLLDLSITKYNFEFLLQYNNSNNNIVKSLTIATVLIKPN